MVSLSRDGALTPVPVQRSRAAGHRLQAADVGYSVTRLVAQRADANSPISFWRSMLAREVASRYGPRTATGPSSVRKHD